LGVDRKTQRKYTAPARAAGIECPVPFKLDPALVADLGGSDSVATDLVIVCHRR
jgi:hypothetical protein